MAEPSSCDSAVPAPPLSRRLLELARNGAVFIPVETPHRIENPGEEPEVLAEEPAPAPRGTEEGR